MNEIIRGKGMRELVKQAILKMGKLPAPKGINTLRAIMKREYGVTFRYHRTSKGQQSERGTLTFEDGSEVEVISITWVLFDLSSWTEVDLVKETEETLA